MSVEGPYVATDNPDDVEFGCQVWSKSHQDSLGYVGGVVIDIDPVARTVTVLGNVLKSRGPEPQTLALDDLQMDLCRFGTKDAGTCASQLFAWLGTLATKKQRIHADMAKWGDIAVRLQALRDSGSNLPGAETRYQARRDAQHTEPVKPVEVVDASEEDIDRIHQEIQRRADLARAKQNGDAA